MSYEENPRYRYRPEANAAALAALKATVAASVARDAALAAYVEAERKLYAAQEQLKAARSFNRALN